MKSVIVPRMELSAAVVATRLDTMSSKELSLPITESFFWTDSTCVLRYINLKSRQTIANICGKSNSNHSQSIVPRPEEICRHSVRFSGWRVKRCVSRLSLSLDSWPRIPNSTNWWMAAATCWHDCWHTWWRSGVQGRNNCILDPVA